MKKTFKVILIVSSSLFGVLITLMGIFLIYVSIYYHRDEERIAKYLEGKSITITELSHSTIEIKGEEEKAGIIFYPGGKVDYLSYEPLLASLAEKGYTSLLLKMPFNLAILNKNAANGYIEKYPQINRWYLMGHSLGGVVASQYIVKHIDQYEGIIMLASYLDEVISSTSIKLLSIRGSEDGVLDISKYNDAKSKWPKVNQESIIEGANHAGYGMYGKQDGDNEAKISNEEQINETSNIIVNFVE